MGFKKISKASLPLRYISLRRKSKAKATEAGPPAPTNQKWEFQVTSNPKEYSDDAVVATVRTSESTATGSIEADDNRDAVEPTTGWGGWLITSCWGSSYKTDDRTFEASCNDDGSCESSQPSLSLVHKVLDVSTAVDDVSDVTSAPSIDEDDESSSGGS
mmetsp:Transcript_33259/g.59896  ORF Transcript_33259/g.59896 Transcript_33259/m.59896 type:complete len:159 (-) Transcript_33259:234-710(-)